MTLQTSYREIQSLLTNFTPEYRLRVGDYRILFETEAEEIIIYRIKHRSKAYF